MRVCVCVCMCACACFSEYVYFCFFISSFFFTFLFFLPHWLRTGKQSVTRGNDKTTRESVRHEPRVRDWKHSSKSSEGGVLALNIYFPSESSTIGDKEVGRSARVIYFAKCSQSFVTWLSVLSPGLASWKFIAMDRRLVATARVTYALPPWKTIPTRDRPEFGQHRNFTWIRGSRCRTSSTVIVNVVRYSWKLIREYRTEVSDGKARGRSCFFFCSE